MKQFLIETDLKLALEDVGRTLPPQMTPDQRRAYVLNYMIDLKLAAQKAEKSELHKSAEFAQKMAYFRQKVLMEALRLEVIAIDKRTEEEIDKEYKELKKAGMEIVKFSPAETKKYLGMAYDEGWKGQLKMEQEYTNKLRKLLTK